LAKEIGFRRFNTLDGDDFEIKIRKNKENNG
jgi:hypothetical protein